MLTKTTKGLWGKLARLMPLIAIAAMLLAACGGAATPVPPTATTMVEVATATVPAVMDAPTATTEAAMPEATATTEAAVVEATPTKVKGAASQEGVLTLWVHKVAVQAVSNVAQDFTDRKSVV